jgi:hypothetical protein
MCYTFDICLTSCYNLHVEKTLTVRLDKSQSTALTARARAQGKTRSALVRELIAQGLEERPLQHRIGHLKGRVELPGAKGEWRRRIKERNWR